MSSRRGPAGLHRHHRSGDSSSSEWVSLKEQLLQFAAVIAVAAVVAFCGITLVEWQKQRFLRFCDTIDPHLHEPCIPCPDNGRCFNGELECFPGYVRYGKLCAHDRQTRKAVQAIEDYIVRQVCYHYTFPRCQLVGPKQLTVLEVIRSMEEARLDERLGADPSKFKLAKDEAIKSAKSKLVTRYNLDSLQELECPPELLEYYKPFLCRVKEWILSNLGTFVISVLSLLLVVRSLFRAYRQRKISQRAEELYKQVCGTLEEKAQDKLSGKETWIVASHLRDHLLTSRERQNNAAWQMVEQMVHKDSRIDQYPKLVKGESKVAWEWQVEGELKSPPFKGVR